jgi:hypothetical protein
VVRTECQWSRDAVVEEGSAGRGKLPLMIHTKNTEFGQGSLRGVANEGALVLLADKKLVIGMGWGLGSHMKTWARAMQTLEARWNLKVDRVGSGTKLESWVPQCMAWVLWIQKIPDGEDIEMCEEWWHLQRGLTVGQSLYRLMVEVAQVRGQGLDLGGGRV